MIPLGTLTCFSLLLAGFGGFGFLKQANLMSGSIPHAFQPIAHPNQSGL